MHRGQTLKFCYMILYVYTIGKGWVCHQSANEDLFIISINDLLRDRSEMTQHYHSAHPENPFPIDVRSL